MSLPSQLPPRERQIMEIVYARGKASVNDVLADMVDPPTRTSVRTILSLLEQKGHLTHVLSGREFVYKPVASKARVGRSALRSVLRAFFADSLPKALAAHLADPKNKLSSEEVLELQTLIAQARKRGD